MQLMQLRRGSASSHDYLTSPPCFAKIYYENRSRSNNFMKQTLKSLKIFWLVLFSIGVAGFVIFSNFYDIAIIKKSSFSKSRAGGSASVQETVKQEPAIQIDTSQIDIDLDNLSEQELASISAFLKFKKIKAQVIPAGVPDVYGEELDISFDQVQDAINKVRIFGPTYGTEENKITLTGPDLERYINIGSQTACKYCCGAKTLVREDSKAACGCAHSTMMRGLAAYLIQNHPELSDEQILTELNTWRRAYFPKQTLSETLSQLKQSGEAGIEQLLQEFPDFLPQMVGGC